MKKTKADLERVSLKRGKRKKMGKIKALTVFLVTLVLIYLVAAVVVSIGSNLSTTVARTGEIRETVRTEGYVFRQQTVMNAPCSGYFECIVGEGERVSEGQVLGYVYPVAPDAAIMEQIKNLHKEINSRGFAEDDEGYTSSVATAEKRISELIRDLSDERCEYDLNNSREYAEKINSIIAKRENEDGSDKTFASVSQLKGELNSLLSQAGGGREIIAPESGVFSMRIDDLEEALEYDKALSATPSYLEGLNISGYESDGYVEMGQKLCKIIDNYNWRLVAEIDEEDTEHISEGKNIQLELFDLTDVTVLGKIARISETENGKKAVVISSNKYVDGIYSSSRVDADIVLVNVNGIKLPSQCLHVKDGVTGVYIRRLDVAVFVPVDVWYKNDEWTIVGPGENNAGGVKLQMYDEVIVSCRNLYDGKIIR